MYLKSLSNSRADTYKQCGLKYDFKYVRYLEEDEGLDQQHFPFGKYIHKICEDGIDLKTIEELEALAEKLRPDYIFEDRNYALKIPKCVKNFFQFNQELEGENVGQEIAYSLPHPDAGVSETAMTGVIDRVVRGPSGSLLVIDYKTSKREKDRASLFLDPQMRGYAWACSQLYKVPYDKIIVAHYYPVSGHLVTVKFGRQQINQWLRERKDLIWRIRKAKKADLVAQENKFCKWCSYRQLCPLQTPQYLVEANLATRKKSKAPNFKPQTKPL